MRPVTTYFSNAFWFENLSCEVWDASNGRVRLIKEKVCTQLFQLTLSDFKASSMRDETES